MTSSLETAAAKGREQQQEAEEAQVKTPRSFDDLAVEIRQIGAAVSFRGAIFWLGFVLLRCIHSAIFEEVVAPESLGPSFPRSGTNFTCASNGTCFWSEFPEQLPIPVTAWDLVWLIASDYMRAFVRLYCREAAWVYNFWLGLTNFSVWVILMATTVFIPQCAFAIAAIVPVLMLMVWLPFESFRLMRWCFRLLMVSHRVGVAPESQKPVVVEASGYEPVSDPLNGDKSLALKTKIDGKECYVVFPKGVIPLVNPNASQQNASQQNAPEQPDGKERVVADNPMKPAENMPACVIRFMNAGGEVIGMGCRIKVAGKTRLVTALHVIEELHRLTDSMICSASNATYPLDRGWKVDTWSKTADFVTVEVPEMIWARLGVTACAIGELVSQAPVHMYGPGQLSMCVSRGMVMEKLSRKLKLVHTASTTAGWSGSPMFSLGKVVGIHLGFDPKENRGNWGLSLSFLQGVKERETLTKGRVYTASRVEDPEDFVDFHTHKSAFNVALKGKYYDIIAADPDFGEGKNIKGISWADLMEEEDEFGQDAYDPSAYGADTTDDRYMLPSRRHGDECGLSDIIASLPFRAKEKKVKVTPPEDSPFEKKEAPQESPKPSAPLAPEPEKEKVKETPARVETPAAAVEAVTAQEIAKQVEANQATLQDVVAFMQAQAKAKALRKEMKSGEEAKFVQVSDPTPEKTEDLEELRRKAEAYDRQKAAKKASKARKAQRGQEAAKAPPASTITLPENPPTKKEDFQRASPPPSKATCQAPSSSAVLSTVGKKEAKSKKRLASLLAEVRSVVQDLETRSGLSQQNASKPSSSSQSSEASNGPSEAPKPSVSPSSSSPTGQN